MEILAIMPSSNSNTHKKPHGSKVVKQQDVTMWTNFAINAQMKATIKVIIKIMKKTTILKDQSCMMLFTMPKTYCNLTKLENISSFVDWRN
jgi:hypothetical protein